MSEKKNPLPIGQIGFRTITEEDIEQLRLWRNDPEVRSQFIYDKEISPAEQEKWYHDHQQRKDDIIWIAYDKTTGKNIGTVALYQINKQEKTGEIGRLMTAPQNKGQGLGRILMQYAVDRAFSDFDLQTVRLEIFYDNIPSMRINLSLGFVPCGVHEVDGRFLIHLSKGKDV